MKDAEIYTFFITGMNRTNKPQESLITTLSLGFQLIFFNEFHIF